MHAHPPYVALISCYDWSVLEANTMKNLCTRKDIFVQQLHLQHATSGQKVVAFNCHVPTLAATEKRKRDVVQKLMEVGEHARRSGVTQPTAAWVLGGDMNLAQSQLMPICSLYVDPGKPCFSKSGMAAAKQAQKSDIAVSQ